MSSVFVVVPPPPDLAPVIAGVWLARGSTEHRREAVLPNGVVELIFNLGGPQWVVDGGPRRRFCASFLAGTQLAPLWIEEESETDLIGVRFRPGGIADWLDEPLRELTQRVESTDDLSLKPWARELREALGNAPTVAERLQLTLEALRRHRRVTGCDGRVRRVLRLEAAAGDFEPASVAAMARRVGVSHKHLISLFQRAVGVSPRQLRRVMRFHGVVTALERSRPASWADLAAHAGYADQSHLIREFRHFASCTPTEFLRRRTADGWHLLPR